MKIDLFQHCGHCWIFQIWGHSEWRTFITSSFRILNTSAGIPSPPLALLVVMLPKAHLTSHSRMSSSRWVNHTIMIIWVVKIFSVLFCVFLPPLNIVCFCLVHTISVLYWTHLCMKCSLGISNLSLSFYCFPLFLCTDHWGRPSYLSLLFLGTLHSNGYIFPFLLCFSLLFFSQLFVRPPHTVILPFCISFSWGWSWSQPLV